LQLISKATISTPPKNYKSTNEDNVRICKLKKIGAEIYEKVEG